MTSAPRGTSEPPRARPKLSRRVFLLALAGAASAAGLASLLRARIHLASELDISSGVGELSEAQLATLAALGDVLVPSKLAGSDEAGRTLREVARDLARDLPGYRLEFERAVALLDDRGRARHEREFAALPIEARRELVDDLLLPMLRTGPIGRRLRRLSPSGQEISRLWRFVVQGLLVGFYSSPLGWRLVGYSVPPGSCAGLDDYQGPPQPVARS